jgi:hypothetical protein
VELHATTTAYAVVSQPHPSRHHHTGHHGLNSQEPDDIIRIDGEKASAHHEGDEIPSGQLDDDNVDAEDAQDAKHENENELEVATDDFS